MESRGRAGVSAGCPELVEGRLRGRRASVSAVSLQLLVVSAFGILEKGSRKG